MPPRKTLDQKQADLHDTHRILREYYFYSEQSTPCGVTIDKIPMPNVPPWHRKQADLLLKELKSRQIVKTRLSEECLRQWVAIVRNNPRASLFWFRDNLPRLLSGMKHSQGKPQTKVNRLINSPVLTLKTGEQLVNNRQTHHMVDADNGQIYCRLTGVHYHEDEFE